MLDIKFIKENKEKVDNAIKNKKVVEKVDVNELLKVHDKYINILRQVEAKRALRNQLSKDISKFSSEQRQKLIEEASIAKEELADMEEELVACKEQIDEMLPKIPNVYSDDTPLGESDEDNKILKEVGEIPKFDFKVRAHIELGKMLDIIDIDKAGEISGSRFYYLKSEAVLLEFALVTFVLKTLTNKKIVSEIAKSVGNNFDNVFIPMLPPVFAKSEIMKKMDRFDPIEDRYYLEEDDLLLVGSAEHTMGSYHMNEVLSLNELPKRYIGFSTAFRREAGSYGRDVKGILRVHQFDKLEMESFSTSKQGLKEQDLFVGIQEYIVSKLELPYQVISICTGDMGKPDFRQRDINTYVPSQEKYRETHTSDYMTNYQARRLNTTYVNEDKEKEYVHMNDATAIAIGRILICILENYQQKDGSVVIPEVLRDYVGLDKIKPKKK